MESAGLIVCAGFGILLSLLLLFAHFNWFVRGKKRTQTAAHFRPKCQRLMVIFGSGELKFGASALDAGHLKIFQRCRRTHNGSVNFVGAIEL